MMDCCAKLYMCEEMVIKILARLPAKSLVRFMAVCRLWKSIITSSPQFRLEFSKQRHTTKLLVHTSRECYSLDDDDDETNGQRLIFETHFPPSKHYNSSYDIPIVIGSDNGLICIGIRKLQADYSNRKDYFFRVIIWNPVIRKHVVIPYNPLVDDNIVYHFEYACGFGDFKYVRVVGARLDGRGSLRKAVDVYSMKSGTWGPRKYLDWDFMHGLSSYSECLNSALLRSRIHWIGGGTRSRSNQIFSFDLEEEAFEDKTIKLPPEASVQYYYSCRRESLPARVSVIRESQLGVITNEIGQQCCAVWVMQEYGNVDSWIKLFNIDLTVENIYRRSGPTMIHLLKDGEILLGLNRMKRVLVTYNLATMKTRNDYFGGGGGGLVLPHQLCGFTNFYKESLVLLADDDDDYRGAVVVADHLSMLDQ